MQRKGGKYSFTKEVIISQSYDSTLPKQQASQSPPKKASSQLESELQKNMTVGSPSKEKASPSQVVVQE